MPEFSLLVFTLYLYYLLTTQNLNKNCASPELK